ncbi:MAG: hypothetical protein H7Y37_10750 [Anaerolineae bacterium]|nr:hypothetical protein [Gloeobacterales cyanobacterium ES-bin-313]
MSNVAFNRRLLSKTFIQVAGLITFGFSGKAYAQEDEKSNFNNTPTGIWRLSLEGFKWRLTLSEAGGKVAGSMMPDLMKVDPEGISAPVIEGSFAKGSIVRLVVDGGHVFPNLSEAEKALFRSEYVGVLKGNTMKGETPLVQNNILRIVPWGAVRI